MSPALAALIAAAAITGTVFAAAGLSLIVAHALGAFDNEEVR